MKKQRDAKKLHAKLEKLRELTNQESATAVGGLSSIFGCPVRTSVANEN